MPLTIDSKVKDLFANPKTAAVIEKYMPGFTTDKRTKMTFGMSFKALCSYPQTGMDKEKTEKLAAELDALGE